MKPCNQEEQERGLLRRSELFFKRFLTGSDILDKTGPCYEQVPGRYDIGAIVREYNRVWLKTPPQNLATPINLLRLLQYLDDFTQRLEAVDAEERGELPCHFTDDGYKQTCLDLERWRVRLDGYLDFVETVPYDEENNRRATLWEVTAPLFLGWYGGETGTEIALPIEGPPPRTQVGGFPPGFNAELQHTPDIATPYMIANQLDVFFDWEQKKRRKLVEDITTPLKSTGSNLLLLAAVAGIGYVGWNFFKK